MVNYNNEELTDGCEIYDIEFTCYNYESEYINERAKQLLNSLEKTK